MNNLPSSDIAAECLEPILSFYTFRSSNASILLGTPLGMVIYYFRFEAFGPRVGLADQRYTPLEKFLLRGDVKILE